MDAPAERRLFNSRCSTPGTAVRVEDEKSLSTKRYRFDLKTEDGELMNQMKSVLALVLTLSACLSAWSSSTAIADSVSAQELDPNQEAKRPDLLDLPTEVLLMKIAPLLGNRSDLHSLASTSHGFLYKLHMRPGNARHRWFEGVAQSLPGLRKTKTGAVYTKVLNHPKLGTAWKDPRGLLWSDRYMRRPDGEILRMNWSDAREHCFNLNGDPARIAEVKQRYQAREDYMTAMRAQFTNVPRGAKDFTRRYAELIIRSQEFGAIAGCYLPSREELANHGVDLGYARGGNSRFSHEVFTEYNDRWLWSGSAHPAYKRGAYGFLGGDGSVGDGYRSYAEAFRCACSP